jgi:hypothetical protein
METACHQLVYYSRNCIPGSDEQVAGSIHSILAASRKNNATVGVTGALLFNNGYFGQVLEGSRAAVVQTFERIQQDPRHSDPLVLSFTRIAKPSFGNWSMAFVGSSVEDAVRYAAVAGESGYDPSQMTGATLFETLHRLMISEPIPAYT